MNTKLKLLFTLLLLVCQLGSHAQNGVVKGRVYNEKNNEPLPYVSIIVQGTNLTSSTDVDGRFIFTGVAPGYVELVLSTIGFERKVTPEFMVNNSKFVNIEIGMKETVVNLETVEVKSEVFVKKEESPVSVKSIGISELERSPGGNRDVSKVIQSLPGVASGVSFRNDVIVRGGGSNENRFYLDDIEIPNLNHFATQGSSGGPVGIINIDFVKEIEFFTGAFPASRGNALSSVMIMKQIEGNKERMQFKGAFGASDLSLAIDGPLGQKTNYLFSYRRSYLQFLFSAIGLPFLPTYNDYQFKISRKINDKNSLNIISLGAYDQSRLNTGLKNQTDYQKYILGYLPENDQWNYTFGIVWKHFMKNGYQNWVVSRNYLNNAQIKYLNNDKSAGIKILDYNSHEIENKFRFEEMYLIKGYRVTAGFGGEYDKYFNQTYNKVVVANREVVVDYTSTLELFRWNLFTQASRGFFNDKLTLSVGFRADANNYSSSMTNLLDQLSPRFSASYNFKPKWDLNFNVARYYQMPAYTTLGYRDSLGSIVNKSNHLTYISVDNIVGGIDFYPNELMKISVESFYKKYNNYPYSIRDSISLANKGADFGVVGDEEVTSTSQGRAYGLELFATQKMSKTINFTLSYTFVRSEFKNADQKYIPSAWDNRHLVNIIVSKSFNKNWTVGVKWRYSGGTPYSPVDLENSALKTAWDIRGKTVFDYSQFNSLRLGPYHQLDVRIDKDFYFKKFSLLFYIDVQNVYNFKADAPDLYVLNRDASGQPIVVNPTAPTNQWTYSLKKIEGSGNGTILPSMGIIVEL